MRSDENGDRILPGPRPAVPTPAELQERADEIFESWSDQERASRCMLSETGPRVCRLVLDSARRYPRED